MCDTKGVCGGGEGVDLGDVIWRLVLQEGDGGILWSGNVWAQPCSQISVANVHQKQIIELHFSCNLMDDFFAMR